MNLDGLDFPISMNHIKKFVCQNPQLDLNLSIYFDHENEIKPWLSNFKIPEMPGANQVDIFMAFPSDFGEGVVLMDGHFLRILDINLFLQKRKPSGQSNKKFLCRDCLKTFSRQIYLDEHVPYCTNARGQTQIIPEEGQTLEFKNFPKQYLSGIYNMFMTCFHNFQICRSMNYSYIRRFGICENMYPTCI